MLDFLHSIFPSLNPGHRKQGDRQSVYRNEVHLKASRMKVNKRVNYESAPLLHQDEEMERIFSCCDEEKKRGGSKVKILMTKETAAKLVSKCKNGGGILGFKDGAQDFKRLPTDHAIVLSFKSKKE